MKKYPSVGSRGTVTKNDTEGGEIMTRQVSKRNNGLRLWSRALGIAAFVFIFTASQAWAAPFKAVAEGMWHITPGTVPGFGVASIGSQTSSGFDSEGNFFVCSGVTTSSEFIASTGACEADEAEGVGTVNYHCQYNGAKDIFNSTGTTRTCVPFSCFDENFIPQVGCSFTVTGSTTATGGDGRAEGSSGSWTSSSTATYTQVEVLESGFLRVTGTFSSELQGDFELADGVDLPGEAEVDADLMGAVTAGDIDAVRMALDEGASVHGRDAAGETPLFHVADPDIARLLLDVGASVHARNNYGMTPLHDASILGRIEIVRLLLEAGAAVYALDERGMTPLAWVENPPWGVPQASDELIQLLKDAGGE